MEIYVFVESEIEGSLRD